jgi:preprotein translocase subunit SecE
MQNLVKYLGSVKEELLKVSWPTKDELVSATTLVVVFALVLSAIVWGFDQVISKIMGFVL